MKPGEEFVDEFLQLFGVVTYSKEFQPLLGLVPDVEALYFEPPAGLA